MPEIDVVDEGVINGSPLIVYKAFLNWAAGNTDWWMPTAKSKLRGDTPMDREGAIFDVVVEPRSYVPLRFSLRTTKIVEGKLVEQECEGDFTGTMTWTLEPTDGKTKVAVRWNVRPKRLLLRFLSRFVDMGKGHSVVVQKGFKKLNEYLTQ